MSATDRGISATPEAKRIKTDIEEDDDDAKSNDDLEIDVGQNDVGGKRKIHLQVNNIHENHQTKMDKRKKLQRITQLKNINKLKFQEPGSPTANGEKTPNSILGKLGAPGDNMPGISTATTTTGLTPSTSTGGVGQNGGQKSSGLNLVQNKNKGLYFLQETRTD